MKTKLILSAVACLVLESFSGPLSRYNGNVAFNNSHNDKITRITGPYHYDSVKVSSAYKFDYPAAAATQAYVRILYPVFTTHNELNDIVSKAILSPLKVNYSFKNEVAATHPALSNMDAINNASPDYQGFAADFLRQFEVQAPKEELQAYWYADIAVKVIADSRDYIAICCKKDFFTGGLHDLYDNIYLNYDISKHRVFTLESQLKPGSSKQLKTIAERIFRKNEGLTATQDLDGYFFENGQFNLPDNFTITAKGLMFFYNYYEIKPFAAGTTELVIPFNDLKDLVMPDSILARQIVKAVQR